MEYLKGSAEQEAVKWMKKAAETAAKALCSRAKCGTVIVKDGEIIGVGYNAPPLDMEENRRCGEEFVPGKPKYDKTCCMHAEWRAIIDALKNGANKIPGSKLYFTRIDNDGNIKRSSRPYCTVCSRMALDAGIDKFLLWHEDGIGEYSTDEYNRLSYEYMPPKNTTDTEGPAKLIRKKILPEYFDAVSSGRKKYELRLNDFEVKEGDILALEEWDARAKKYTGRKLEKKVAYVGKFKIDKLFWPEEEIKEKGIQIISLD